MGAPNEKVALEVAIGASFGGTGLVMPIAKKICEEHGGTLLITSQSGAGTEARVWLPRRKSGGRKSP